MSGQELEVGDPTRVEYRVAVHDEIAPSIHAMKIALFRPAGGDGGGLGAGTCGKGQRQDEKAGWAPYRERIYSSGKSRDFALRSNGGGVFERWEVCLRLSD
jgi:hypothetical protein